MGAALTYARRYALFTLVGIAGEDDLDAPDLPAIKLHGGTAGPMDPGKMNGHAAAPATRSNRKARPPVPILDATASAALRDRLSAEVAGLGSGEASVEWARRNIAAKNTLTTEDASAVETAFRGHMNELESASASPMGASGPDNHSSGEIGSVPEQQAAQAMGEPRAKPVDKAVLTISEPRRYRNKEHLRFVAQQACLICGRTPSDAHHIRFMQPRAMGRKVSDEFVAPLCRTHHRAVHHVGDERAWWKQAGIDPAKVARKLWKRTRLSERTTARKPGLEPAAAFGAPPGSAGSS